MINLRPVYKRAEEHMNLAIGGLFVLLILLILLQSIFSPELILSAAVVSAVIVMTVRAPSYTLALIAVYLPFESIVLKFTPDEVYVFARYFAEGLIYLVAFVVLWRFISGRLKYEHTPIDLPMLFFVLVLTASIAVNFVHPLTAFLGLRQILRFILVFFLVMQLKPEKKFIQYLTIVMMGIVLFQSALGIIQSFAGETLDAFLLPSEERTLGSITLTAGVEQFWDPGSRVFATLGRYDRLGNFLYMFLLIGAGLLFSKKYGNDKRLLLLFALGLPALVLTYSRASWFAFLLGFLFIGLVMYKNKLVLAAVMSFVLLTSAYLGLSGMNVSQITELPGQTLTERFYESFSYARWRGEYHGLGRVFWFIQTPSTVVAAAPLFGFGPGQFGGGVAAALHNTHVYEELGLPFGVFGTEGFIDNNWFSLWGESGTLGLICFIWVFIILFQTSLRIANETKDPFTKAVCLGFCACVIGVAFNAMTSTLFEIRTIAFYFWLYAGFVFVLGKQEKLL